VDAVDVVSKLKPAILLTTHSATITGGAAIRQRLQDYRDGLAFVLDQTLKGILLGQGPDELRYTVRLPKRLQETPILIQNYGVLAAMPPRIFNALFGQFDRNAAMLNKLHPIEEAERMVQAMGGEDATFEKKSKAHEDGDYLWSCQLADYLVKADNREKNRQLKANCLRQMGYRALSTNARSWYLSQALELEGKTAILKSLPALPDAVSANLADFVNYYRVPVDPDRAADTDEVLGLHFDTRAYGLHVRRSVVDLIPDLSLSERKPDVTVSMAPRVWVAVFNNLADPGDLTDKDEIKVVQGDAAEAKALFAMFDPIYDWKNDKALQVLGHALTGEIGLLDYGP